MLNVDLSTLRGQELRQLLDTTRRRGDAAVTYEILQEMAARRERGEPEQRRSLFGSKRPAEARVIELNLGDPLDPKDPELDEAATHPHVEDWELEAAENDDDEATYLHPPRAPDFDEPPPPKPKPRRRALWLSSGLAVGLVVGLALGGWAESVSQQARSPLAVAAAVAAPPPAPAVAAPPVDPIAVETGTAPASPDAVAGAVTPIPAPPPSSAAAPIPGAAPPAKPAPEMATAAPAPVEVAEETAPEPAKGATKAAEKAAAVKEAVKDTATDAPAGAKAACASQPTPADRIICGTPRLQRLQKELRQAYADALDAHQDRDLLREHQLAWREARNTVTEPDRLAQLYEARIRKLNAAAEAARAAR